MKGHHHFAGWDIGGAHLKMVCMDQQGRIERALQLSAPLWDGLDHLGEALTEACRQLPHGSITHAITMTAELVDCFPDRPNGVRQVLDSVAAPLSKAARVYGFSGFMATSAARQRTGAVASANWHAGARLIAGHVPEAIFIDIGSTTSDVIPVRNGRPAMRGYTDRSRMQYDELVYSGVIRTPVMALARRAPVAGVWQHLTAEIFATMADVYRLTGDLASDADTTATADGGGHDSTASMRRLARMAGTDHGAADGDIWHELARYLKQQQLALLKAAIVSVIDNAALHQEAPLIGAGCGRFLIPELAAQLNRPYHDVAMLLPTVTEFRNEAATYWPAYAVAELLRRGVSE